MDRRPTATRAFELGIDFAMGTCVVAQLRRRPDAILVLRAQRPQLEQTSRSVALLYGTGAATSVTANPLFHDETEESVDVRQ